MNRVQVLVVGMFSLLVVACGGGGGGGGGNSGDKQIDDSFKLRTYPAIVYEGNETSAALVQTNLPSYVANFYQITQLVVSNTVEALVGTFSEPYFLAFDEGDDASGGEDEEVCQSGQFEVDDKTNAETGLGRLVVQFTNCVMDDVKIDGQIVYDITAMGSLPRAATTSIDQLAVEVDNERLVLQGDFDLEFDQSFGYVLQGQAIMTSALQNRQFKLEKLKISKADARAAVDAEFWDSVDGKVTIKSEMNESRITFAGIDETLGVLDFDFDDPMGGYVIEGFKLALTNAAQSQFELIGDFQPDAILEWPYTTNRQPFAVSSVPVSVDRNALVTLDAAEYVSDHDDLLIYSFRVTGAPAAGCGHEIDQQDVRTVDLVFSCQGDYVLEIGARDGTTAPFALPLTVHVIPLPAEFERVDALDVEKGSQLNVALNVVNEALDGPFGFSIGHAPKGVNVTEQGVVFGVPHLLLYENNSSVSVEAVADNGRQSSIQFNVNVRDPSVQLDISPFADDCENERWGLIDQNNSTDYICKWGNSYLMYELVEGKRFVSHVGRDFSGTSRLQSMELQDFDSDGIPELILVYEDSVHVVKPILDQEIGAIPLAKFNGLASFLGSKVYPAEASMNAFVLQSGARFFLYSIGFSGVVSTFETGASQVTAAGSIDADAEPEFLMDDGRLYGFGSAVRNLASLVGGKAAFIANVAGSAASEIVVVEGNTECSFPSSLLVSVYNASNLTRLSQSSIQNPLGAQVPWCPNLAFVKAGSNLGADLYAGQPFAAPVYRYSYANGAFSLARTFDYGNEQLGNTLWGLSVVEKQLVQHQHNAVQMIDIDTGDLQEFSFMLGSGFSPDSGPVWNGGRILANYLTSNPAVSPLGYLEFDGNDTLNWSVIEPVLSVPAKEVLSPLYYQTTDDVSVGISKSNADAAIRLYSVPDGELVGQVTGNRNTFSGDRWTVSDIDGDGEYDAFKCGIPGTVGALAWYRLNSNTPAWQADIRSVSGTQAICVATALIGRTFGESQRLAAIFRHVSGGAFVVVYDYSGVGVVEVARYPIESTGSYSYSIAVLDVTGDYTDEIVVYRDATRYYSQPLSKFWVISNGIGSVYSFDSAVSEPVVQKNRPVGNRSLLVAGAYGELLESPANVRRLYSKLYEISPKDGAIVWQSNELVGSISEFGYYNLATDAVGEKVLVVTSKGLHFYH